MPAVAELYIVTLDTEKNNLILGAYTTEIEATKLLTLVVDNWPKFQTFLQDLYEESLPTVLGASVTCVLKGTIPKRATRHLIPIGTPPVDTPIPAISLSEKAAEAVSKPTKEEKKQ